MTYEEWKQHPAKILCDAVCQRVRTAYGTMYEPRDLDNGTYWFDFKNETRKVTVGWKKSQGYDIALNRKAAGFDETYVYVGDVVDRVAGILGA